MLQTADFQAECSEDFDWANRGEFWNSLRSEFVRPRKLRQRNPNPLILCGHGASMRIENRALVIRDGFTHYPQHQAAHRFFPRDLDLPDRIMLLDGSGTLSFEVLTWLSAQGVSLLRVNWKGEVASVSSGSGFAADPAKLHWQHETRENGQSRYRFAADIIRTKVIASIQTLETYIPNSRAREIAIAKAKVGIERLTGNAFSDMNEIFAIEGECASAYFASWHGLEIQWKGLGKRPVPKGWHVYSGRSSLATGVKAENRNASHPLNAMLNYGYAVKLATLKLQAIADGYDPTFGIMHNGKKGNPALVLDLIEPERPRVDAAILKLVREQRFAASDFVMRTNGSVRLSPQLARVVAAAVDSRSYSRDCCAS
jgi:CRISPR-associated protein Cas1